MIVAQLEALRIINGASPAGTPTPVVATLTGGGKRKSSYRRVIQLKSGEQLIANSETEFREIIQALIAEKTASQPLKTKPKISRKIRQRVKPQRKLQEFTDYESLFRRLDELQNSLISEQLLLELIAASANAQALLIEEDGEFDFILSVI